MALGRPTETWILKRENLEGEVNEKMKKRTVRTAAIPAALAAVLGVFVLASAQNWSKKSYKQWSRTDCEQILNDSPWALKHAQRTGGSDAGRDSVITARLRSALPIREALVRQMEIDNKYDKMSPADKEAFDAKTKPILDCPSCSNTYAIALNGKVEEGTTATSTHSGMQSNDDPVYEWLKNATLDQLKIGVVLENERGERRPLVYFKKPEAKFAEAVFVFARNDSSGKPFLLPSDKKVVFRFDQSNSNSAFNFEFDVSKLILADKVQF